MVKTMMLTTDVFESLHLPLDELLELRWRQALVDHDDNLVEAAKDLGVSVSTLRRWMKRASQGADRSDRPWADCTLSSLPVGEDDL
jgi:hypothetical protein